MQQLILFDLNSVPGTSAPGTSASGTSASGTSASGTSASGTSASGTSAPGTQHPARGPLALAFVRHSKARRYILRVTCDGVVRVTIPRWGSKREAQLFADSQRPWIDKQLARWRAEQAAERARVSPDVVRQLITRARRELPVRLLELAAEHGLTVARISIRNQRWRWGSCSPSGHICLNWLLVTMPDWVRDYVLIHELMHLKRMDHSRKFWKLVAAACPRFRDARAWLRDRRTFRSAGPDV
jgi:predicted metal-dependent hydrolase